MKATYTQKFDISDEERRLFRQAFANIRSEASSHSTSNTDYVDKKPYPYPLSDQYPDPVGENEAIEYAAKEGSLSYKIQREIKSGGFAVEVVLDLHGYALEEACYQLSLAIQDAYESETRRLLVIHGKGQHGLLKQYTAHWLKQMPPVMYFCSALSRHGGTGALYVLLKRNKKEIF